MTTPAIKNTVFLTYIEKDTEEEPHAHVKQYDLKE